MSVHAKLSSVWSLITSEVELEKPGRGFFALTVVVCSAQCLLHWWGFFPTPSVSGTVTEPSVDVDDGGAGSVKQARLAFSRCAADMVPHMSTVSLCLAWDGTSIKSPRPSIARSPSQYWPLTSWRSLSITSGSCGRHWVNCLMTRFMDSELLFVHPLRPATTLLRSNGWSAWSSWRILMDSPATHLSFGRHRQRQQETAE